MTHMLRRIAAHAAKFKTNRHCILLIVSPLITSIMQAALYRL